MEERNSFAQLGIPPQKYMNHCATDLYSRSYAGGLHGLLGCGGREFGPINAVGFACFGPLDLRVASRTYGHLPATPKTAWSHANLLAPQSPRFDVPVAIDTYVAVAALAEWRLDGGRQFGSIAYVTVGTGIGSDLAPQNTMIGKRPLEAALTGSTAKCQRSVAPQFVQVSGLRAMPRWTPKLPGPRGAHAAEGMASHLGQR